MLEKAIKLLGYKIKYSTNPLLQDLHRRKEQAVQLIQNTLQVGTEYSNSQDTIFGVFLEEMSTTQYPYRVSWYDKDGFFSHQAITDKDHAVRELIDMLGYELKLASGNLERLFPYWELVEKHEAVKILAQKQDVEYMLTVLDYHSGELFGVVYATADDVVIGKLNFSYWEHADNFPVRIQFIEVVDEYKRQGIATGMVNRLKEEFPGEEIDYGMTTSEGGQFVTSLGRAIKPLG